MPGQIVGPQGVERHVPSLSHMKLPASSSQQCMQTLRRMSLPTEDSYDAPHFRHPLCRHPNQVVGVARAAKGHHG